MNHDEAISKVRKLLALSESDNIHESALALGRAQAIMERHRIDAAMLDEGDNDGDSDEEITRWEDPLDNTRDVWRGVLAVTLTKANGCYTYRSDHDKIIIGTATNAGTVRYLYAFCVREIIRLAAKQKGNGRTWLNNYRHGCVDAIRQAIKSEREALHSKIREEAPTESALVVINSALAKVDNESALAEQITREMVPGLCKSSSNSRVNHSARAAGRRDGAGIYPGSGARTGIGSGAKRLTG